MKKRFSLSATLIALVLFSTILGAIPQVSAFKEYFSVADPGIDVKYLQSDVSVTSDTGGTALDTYIVYDLEDKFSSTQEKIMMWIQFRGIPSNATPTTIYWYWYLPNGILNKTSSYEIPATSDRYSYYYVWDTYYLRGSPERNTAGIWRVDVYAESEIFLTQTFEILEFRSGESPSPSTSPGGGFGCFIATAAFGSPLAQEVTYMRYVRDDLIGSSATGAVLVDAWNNFYYSWSPTVADAIVESTALQTLFRGLLVPLMGSMHIVDLQYHSLAWLSPDFAALIAFMTAALLSIGIYITLPILAIVLLAKARHLIKRSRHKR